MTADVVTLQPRAKPERLIWVCRCGCTTHYHHADGGVECGSCGNVAADLTGEWRSRLPDEPDAPADLDGENFKVTSLTGPDTFLKRHAKAVEDVVAIIILNDDGSFATWSGDMTGDERSAWLGRKLEAVHERLTALGAKA